MEVLNVFRLAKRNKEGVKVYWDGTESKHSTSYNSFVSVNSAYSTITLDALKKKVSKVKKKFLNKAETIQILSNNYQGDAKEHYLTRAKNYREYLDNTFVEISESRVVAEIPLED